MQRSNNNAENTTKNPVFFAVEVKTLLFCAIIWSECVRLNFEWEISNYVTKDCSSKKRKKGGGEEEENWACKIFLFIKRDKIFMEIAIEN